MNKKIIIPIVVLLAIVLPIVWPSSDASNVSYVIGWEPESQFPLTVTNDEFSLEIEEATFSLFSVEATICTPSFAWWQPGVALAAHSGDSTKAGVNDIEVFASNDLKPRTYKAELEQTNYCELHMAFGPRDDQPTMSIKGTLDTRIAQVPFVIESRSAFGDTTDLTFNTNEHSQIGITFNLPLLFANISTEQTNNPDELVKELASNLIDFASIEVR